jgi:hypothetical protein
MLSIHQQEIVENGIWNDFVVITKTDFQVTDDEVDYFR